MQPRIINNHPTQTSTTISCSECRTPLSIENGILTSVPFYPNNFFPICQNCLLKWVTSLPPDDKWNSLSLLCQTLDIPFIPSEYERLASSSNPEPIISYCRIFTNSKHASLSWKEYEQEFLRLKNENLLQREIPIVQDQFLNQLVNTWGDEFDEKQLLYLHNLYESLVAAKGITSPVQADQAQKLCLISLQINERIKAGLDFDKLIGSYEKMSKIADITAKTLNRSNDFESVGELVAWLEKRGWINHWYDGSKKDIVDETMASMQKFVQRLYTDETGLAEDISERLERIRLSNAIEENNSIDWGDTAENLFAIEEATDDELADRDSVIVDDDGFFNSEIEMDSKTYNI